LFILSSISVFINTEPFTIAGIFLIICYLPGLCIFALFKRGNLLFEDLILAFPCSIGISSVLTLALLFLGVNVKYVPIIIHIIVGIAVVIFIIAKKRNRVYADVKIKKQEILFFIFTLVATLLLSIPFFLGPDRITIASHVFHHSAMVTQIINGIFPPENPGLGGTSIGYYWGFHALIAALSTKTNYHQIQIVFVLNALSLYMIFCIAYSFAKVFNLSEVYRYILPLAVIGLMRLDAGILVLLKLFSGNLIPVENITVSLLHPHDILESWLSGLFWLDTRLLFIVKFYNVSGMPLAISLCFAYLLLLLLILKRKTNINIYIIVLGIIIAACFFNYPPLAIFLLIHAPLWTCFIYLSTHGNFREKTSEALKIALPYIIAILIVCPYMLYVIKSRGISSSSQGNIFTLDFYDQSFKNMVVFLVPLPVIISGAWIAFKRLSFSKEFFFLLIGTTICLCLTIFTRWPFNNSYKFNYIQTFFFSFLFVFALSSWLPLLVNRWLNRLVTAGIVSFLFLTPLIILISYISASFYTDYRYVFSGKHYIYAQDKLKNEAYKWIRENTPKDALLMLSYVETNWPSSGLNASYEVAAIAERNLYAIKDTDYTTSNPEYVKRIRFREKLFENPADPRVVDFFTSLHHPVYLLVEENLRDVFLEEKRFKHFPENPGEPFILLFRNDKQRVYIVKYKNFKYNYSINMY
jgi:hypothetical protein